MTHGVPLEDVLRRVWVVVLAVHFIDHSDGFQSL